MKKIYTLIGLLLVTTGAFAQQDTEIVLSGSTTTQSRHGLLTPDFYIMPYFGMGLQRSYNADFYNDPSIKLSATSGTSSGITILDSVSSHLMVGIGIGYSCYGTIAEYTKTMADGGQVVSTYYDNYSYLIVPLSITLKSGYANVNRSRFGFYIQFQLTPSYNISAIQKQTLSGSSLTYNGTAGMIGNIRSQVKPMNLMLGLSGGLTFPVCSRMICEFGPYYSVALLDSKKAPYLNYTTVAGTSESYTPTIMKALGAQIGLAFRIGEKIKK